MESILGFFSGLIHLIVIVFFLLAATLIVVSLLPSGNPLKMLLGALAQRLTATLFVGATALPVGVMPGLNVLYDVATPIVLIVYWVSFFRRAWTIFQSMDPEATTIVTARSSSTSEKKRNLERNSDD